MLGSCSLKSGLVALLILAPLAGPSSGQTRRPPPAKRAAQPEAKPEATAEKARPATAKGKLPRVSMPLSEWRKRLDPLQFQVSRMHGTERAFTGIYWNHHEDGAYSCVGCQTPLFDSRAKFDSGTGWPSYWAPLDYGLLKTRVDTTTGEIRTEVLCRVCDGHLGHVFQDGPRPTGLRYCMNSASLQFIGRPEVEEHWRKWREAYGLEDPQAEPSGPKGDESASSPPAPEGSPAGSGHLQ